MLGFVLDGAHWLDAWLKAHLGRLYNLILGLGLGLGISAAIASLEKEVGQGEGAWKLAGLIAFQALLLLNQLAQLREFRADVRARRAERRAARRTGANP
jgi:Zn-dependent protease with chaperone function